jgi:phage portal protein BeeE
VQEVARWFGLPPHKLKEMTKSSFNNIESEQISYVVDSIRPWLVRFETSYNVQLLSVREQANHYFKHTVEGLLRGDSKSRSEFYGKMWSIGAMSQNEIRELEDLNPIEGGDELYIPLNMAPSSRVNELLDNRAKQNTIDVTPSEDGEDVDDNQKNKTKLKMLTNKKS